MAESPHRVPAPPGGSQVRLGLAGRIRRVSLAHADVPIHLGALAAVWAAGAGFLMVRGGGLAWSAGPPGGLTAWALPVLLAGAVVGAVKARLVLVPYAARAVRRVHARGRSSLLGFLAPRSWAFVAVMMGTGVLLRHSALAEAQWGRALLCGLYMAVGTALAAADLVVLLALVDVLRGGPVATPGSDVGVA